MHLVKQVAQCPVCWHVLPSHATGHVMFSTRISYCCVISIIPYKNTEHMSTPGTYQAGCQPCCAVCYVPCSSYVRNPEPRLNHQCSCCGHVSKSLQAPSYERWQSLSHPRRTSNLMQSSLLQSLMHCHGGDLHHQTPVTCVQQHRGDCQHHSPCGKRHPASCGDSTAKQTFTVIANPPSHGEGVITRQLKHGCTCCTIKASNDAEHMKYKNVCVVTCKGS